MGFHVYSSSSPEKVRGKSIGCIFLMIIKYENDTVVVKKKSLKVRGEIT